MSKYGTMKEIAAQIQGLLEKMQLGRLNAAELEELVSLTRDLNEKVLIVRYKAYEQKVFGHTSPVEAAIVSEVVPEPEPTEEPEPEVQVMQEENTVIPEVEIPAESGEEPLFGFDLFAAADEETQSRDAFQIGEMVKEESIEIVSVEHTEEVIEDNLPEEEITIQEEVINRGETIQVVEEPVKEREEAPVQQETPAQDIFKHFRTIDESASPFMNPKIATLTTAFGLNERLQCVRELFQGSSEAFVSTIETVDKMNSFAEAKQYLSSVAMQNNWNLEGNLVKEFIQKIERRFL